MAQQDWFEFEDLGPEGEDIEAPDSSTEPVEEFGTGDLDEPLLGSLGEYEFGEAFETFEDIQNSEDSDLKDEEFFGNEQRQHIRSRLANLAAQTALKAASRATTTTIFSGNRHKSVSVRQAKPLTEWFEDEYLADELEEEMLPGATANFGMTTWSAELHEAYELMEKLATAAAAARSKIEAERLVAAMVPLAVRLFPNVYRALWVAIPALIQGTGSVTRLLYRQPITRSLIRKIPAILQHTVAQLAQHAKRGQSINQRLTARVLANQIAATLPQRSGHTSSSTARRPMHTRLKSNGRY